MTTTTVSDAVILPQSQGTGLSGENATIDAAINGVLNRYVGGEYVSSTYSTGLAFQNHNASNDTVEVGPGIVFVQDNSTSTSGERGSGGNPQAESSTTSGYDTELPEGHTYAVLLPTATQISVSDSALNEVYVDLPDVTANNSVNLEHDGSSSASPGNTSLKIGETSPDDASVDTRANDDANPTFNSLKARQATIDNETFIRATRSSETSLITSGNFINVFDNEQKDSRGEFNNNQFTPDKTGEYGLQATIELSGNTSGNDDILARVRDVTNGTTIGPVLEQDASRDNAKPPFLWVVELTAGVDYEIQAKNDTSDFTINKFQTEGTIRWSLVQ